MKKLLIKILFTAFFIFGLSGCYTIIWSPDAEFPTQDNSDNSTIYYGDTYYGDYYYYYDTPWWYDYVPPVSSGPATKTRNDNTDIGRLRDSGDSRGDAGRIPDVQPPSKSENPPQNTNDKGNTNNTGTSTETSARNSSSSSSGNTGGSGSVRNNDGGRSSGGRR